MSQYDVNGSSFQVTSSITCFSSNWLYYGEDGKVYQVAADNSLLPTAVGQELSVDELRSMGVKDKLPFYFREIGDS